MPGFLGVCDWSLDPWLILFVGWCLADGMGGFSGSLVPSGSSLGRLSAAGGREWGLGLLLLGAVGIASCAGQGGVFRRCTCSSEGGLWGGVGAGVRFRALQESSCAVARKGAQSSVMGYMAAYGSGSPDMGVESGGQAAALLAPADEDVGSPPGPCVAQGAVVELPEHHAREGLDHAAVEQRPVGFAEGWRRRRATTGQVRVVAGHEPGRLVGVHPGAPGQDRFGGGGHARDTAVGAVVRARGGRRPGTSRTTVHSSASPSSDTGRRTVRRRSATCPGCPTVSNG